MKMFSGAEIAVLLNYIRNQWAWFFKLIECFHSVYYFFYYKWKDIYIHMCVCVCYILLETVTFLCDGDILFILAFYTWSIGL